MVAAGPDDDTTPLPVVLPGGDRPRGPFEPIVRESDAEPPAAEPPGIGPPPSLADAKLDEIKDLYLTAEAIGEDNLAKHFEQVSDRQRQLIKEYFDRSATDRPDG